MLVDEGMACSKWHGCVYICICVCVSQRETRPTHLESWLLS